MQHFIHKTERWAGNNEGTHFIACIYYVDNTIVFMSLLLSESFE